MNEHQQYNEVCKKEFAEIKEAISDIHKKLFEGNGQPGIATRLCLHDLQIRGLMIVAGVMLTAVIGQIVGGWWK